MSSHYSEEKDNVNESFSKIYEFVQDRNSTFVRKKVGKKYNGPFKFTEDERNKRIASIESEIDRLIKKLGELASLVGQK